MMGLFGFLKKNKSTGQVPSPEQSDDLPPIPAPPGQQAPSFPSMQAQEDNPDLSQLDDMTPLEPTLPEPDATGAQNSFDDLTKAPPEPVREPSPLPESWQTGGEEELQNASEQDDDDALPEKPLVNIDDLAPMHEEDADSIPFSSPPPEEEPRPLIRPEPESQQENNQLPEFTQEELQPVDDVQTQMFSGPERPRPTDYPNKMQKMPAYSYDTLPKEDDYIERKRRGPIEIYVSANDYAKLFREINRIDGLAKHSFKTVMKIRDISGNQNNLLKKYHADLDFINERLAYIDTVLFETD